MKIMIKMRRIACVWLLVMLPQLIWAAAPEAVFEQANEAYARGEYAQALELYQSVADMGYESVALYYNLGNAAYKESQLARAILNYERAARLDPGNEDVAFNLKLANMRLVDKVEVVPQFLVARWWNQFLNGRSSGSWAIWATVFVWLAFIVGVVFLFINRSVFKRIAFFGGIALVAVSLFCVVLGLRKRDLEVNSRYGIVMEANAYVKSAPGEQGTDLFIIHEGLKVSVKERTGNWMRIQLADGKLGWLNEQQIEEI